MNQFIQAVDVPVFLHLKALRQELAEANPRRAEDAYALALIGLDEGTTPQFVVSHFPDRAAAEKAALRQFKDGGGEASRYATCATYGACKDPQCDCGGRLRFTTVLYQLN